jgi:hypothetical protein
VFAVELHGGFRETLRALAVPALESIELGLERGKLCLMLHRAPRHAQGERKQGDTNDGRNHENATADTATAEMRRGKDEGAHQIDHESPARHFDRS